MSSEKREFDFTRKQFVWVRDKLYEHCGIVLSDHKESMAYNRLVRRVRDLKLDGFEAYLSYLDSHPAEFNQFINALTTNLTAFFREAHHFDYVRDTIVPQIRQSGRRTTRCWSAGCSLGEETYSLAMTLGVLRQYALYGLAHTRHGYRLRCPRAWVLGSLHARAAKCCTRSPTASMVFKRQRLAGG